MRTKKLIAAIVGLSFAATGAQAADDVVKIGVLTDLSATYSDFAGAGSVWAAKRAVEDYLKAHPGMKVEVVSADHQNKPDIAANAARQWFDTDGVDVIVDLVTSSVALAVINIAKEKNKVALVSGGWLFRHLRQGLHRQLHSLDLRYVGTRERNGFSGGENGWRQLVFPDR